MKTSINTTNLHYCPTRFLNKANEMIGGVKNDAKLSEVLGILPSTISKIRNRKIAVGPSVLIALHDLTGLPIREILKWADV